jgi:hypothetical protein
MNTRETPDPLLRLHSTAVSAPKKVKTTKPAPLHPICAAMGKSFWAQEDARIAKNDPAQQTETAGADQKTTGPVRAAVAGSPVWRSGNDVQMADRMPGFLWHSREIGKPYIRRAAPSEMLAFQYMCEYRPAAPGAKPGDPYDETRYASDLVHA